jgi:hypothetical protein
MHNFWTIFGVWMAAFLTLAIFSFLYKDNPFYKLAEHLYVGTSAGYMLIYTYFLTIKPMLIDPITKQQQFFLFIPAFFGIIMLTRWFPKIAWLSRWSIAFTIGIGTGLAITGSIQGILIPQIKGTLIALHGWNWTTLNNLLIIIGVISTLTYFYFSKAHKGVIGKTAKIGIIYIMIAFGASFGYTVMGRISLLIGRMYFLFHDWIPLIR